MTTSLSNLEIIELKQFLWQFWLSLSFFVFFFIQLFPNWTACSPIYSDLKHRQWKLLIPPFHLAFWIFFLYNLSLTFLSILQNPSYLEMFWKFPWPSQVGYQNILQLKGRSTSKVTPEDGWWFQAFQVSKAFFLTF